MAALAPIGLDIGSTSIRAVEVSRAKERPVIHNFGQAILPSGAVVGGVVKDERAVSNALRQLWTAQAFKTKSVSLGVTHQQVVVREVEVTSMSAKELRQSLPFQVRDVLPLPVEEALLDFYPLETPDKSSKRATVRGLLIAAPKEAVTATVRAVEKAGLHVAHVDLSCFAALRAAARLDADTEAVVDIGANGTNIIIHTGGVPHMVRTIPRGGAEVTKLVATRFELPGGEAETLKCRVGLGADADADTREVVTEAVRPLISEIRSSFAYYATSREDGFISRLALVGGASRLPGLVEELGKTLGVSTYLSDPLQHVGDSRRGGRHDVLGRFRSSAAVSIGLTLGAA